MLIRKYTGVIDDLGQYIKDHSHLVLLGSDPIYEQYILAREIHIRGDIKLVNSLTSLSYELDIICDQFYVHGDCTVDVSGADAIDWKSYNPDDDDHAKNGMKGFRAGKITLRSRKFGAADPDAKLCLKAHGGDGGRGQMGYWGLIGKAGEEIPVWQHAASAWWGGPIGIGVAALRAANCDGHRGENGRLGACGGDGVDSGNITVDTMSSIDLLKFKHGGGYGGKRGKGGPGGRGGPAGSRLANRGPDGHDRDSGHSGQTGQFTPISGCHNRSAKSYYQTLQMDEMDVASALNQEVNLFKESRQTYNETKKNLIWLRDISACDALHFVNTYKKANEFIDSLPNTLQASLLPELHHEVPVDVLTRVLDHHFSDLSALEKHPRYGEDIKALRAKHEALFPEQQHSRDHLGGLAHLGLGTSFHRIFSHSLHPMHFDQIFVQACMEVKEKVQSDAKGEKGISLTSLVGPHAASRFQHAPFNEVTLDTIACGFEGAAVADGGLTCFDPVSIVIETLIAVAICAIAIQLANLAMKWITGYQKEIEQYEHDLEEQSRRIDANNTQNSKERRMLRLRHEHNQREDTATERRRRLRRKLRLLEFEAYKRIPETLLEDDDDLKFFGVLDSCEKHETKSGRYIVKIDAVLIMNSGSDSLNTLAAVASFHYFPVKFYLHSVLTGKEYDYLLKEEGQWFTFSLTKGKDTEMDQILDIKSIKNPSFINFKVISVGIRKLIKVPYTYDSLIKLLTRTLQVPIPPLKDNVTGQQEEAQTKLKNIGSSVTRIRYMNVGQAGCHVMYSGHNEGDLSLVYDVGWRMKNTVENSLHRRQIIRTIENADQKVPIVLSHWHYDHFCMAKGSGYPLLRRPWLAPTFGIYGPIANLIAVALHENHNLYLFGSITSLNVLDYNSLRHIIYPNFNCYGFYKLVQDGAFSFPAYTRATLTNIISLFKYDHNNYQAIVLCVQGYPNKTLLPGDASYRYIPQDFKTNLSHLEATHHGSCHSILHDDTGSDIPPFCSTRSNSSAGTVYFSYGTGNQYDMSISNVAHLYRAKGWTMFQATEGDYYIEQDLLNIQQISEASGATLHISASRNLESYISQELSRMNITTESSSDESETEN